MLLASGITDVKVLFGILRAIIAHFFPALIHSSSAPEPTTSIPKSKNKTKKNKNHGKSKQNAASEDAPLDTANERAEIASGASLCAELNNTIATQWSTTKEHVLLVGNTLPVPTGDKANNGAATVDCLTATTTAVDAAMAVVFDEPVQTRPMSDDLFAPGDEITISYSVNRSTNIAREPQAASLAMVTLKVEVAIEIEPELAFTVPEIFVVPPRESEGWTEKTSNQWTQFPTNGDRPSVPWMLCSGWKTRADFHAYLSSMNTRAIQEEEDDYDDNLPLLSGDEADAETEPDTSDTELPTPQQSPRGSFAKLPLFTEEEREHCEYVSTLPPRPAARMAMRDSRNVYSEDSEDEVCLKWCRSRPAPSKTKTIKLKDTPDSDDCLTFTSEAVDSDDYHLSSDDSDSGENSDEVVWPAEWFIPVATFSPTGLETIVETDEYDEADEKPLPTPGEEVWGKTCLDAIAELDESAEVREQPIQEAATISAEVVSKAWEDWTVEEDDDEPEQFWPADWYKSKSEPHPEPHPQPQRQPKAKMSVDWEDEEEITWPADWTTHQPSAVAPVAVPPTVKPAPIAAPLKNRPAVPSVPSARAIGARGSTPGMPVPKAARTTSATKRPAKNEHRNGPVKHVVGKNGLVKNGPVQVSPVKVPPPILMEVSINDLFKARLQASWSA